MLICATCQNGAGHAIAAKVEGAVPGVSVALVECMNVCDRPVTCALRAEDRDVYLFGDVTAEDVDQLIALMRLFRDAAPTITDARPAGRLRHCLIGRVPR